MPFLVKLVLKVGSFDGGWGASYIARIVRAEENSRNLVLCRQYNAQRSIRYGIGKYRCSLCFLKKETVRWCREMLENSPMALRCLKAALNADCDGQAGPARIGW